MTTTSRPFDSVKLVISGPVPAWAGAASAAARAAMASVSRLGTICSRGTRCRPHDARSDGRTRVQRSVAGTRNWMRRVVAGGSRLLPALELLVRRRDLALILHAHPVRVVGRGGLIAGRRRGHGLPRRLAGEWRRFGLRRSKRRPYGTEYLFGLGAEIGGHHRTRSLVAADAGGLGVGALLAGAGLVELVGPQRPHLLFHGHVALQSGFHGRRLLLAAVDIRILRPGRGLGGDLSFVARRRQIAAGRHHQRRTLAVIDHRVALALEPEIFHELAKDLAIERNVFVIVGVFGACTPCAPRQ